MNQLCPLCFHAVDTVLDDFETAHKRVSHKTKEASCVVPNKLWGEYVTRQARMDSWKSGANAEPDKGATTGNTDTSPANDYYPGCV